MFDLDRFLEAQEPVFETALRELRAGSKQSHWMWFVFPQQRGLGRSSLANYYGLASLEEARAYLQHPVLGDRLRKSVEAVLSSSDRSLLQIFGTPDDLKFCSSMTVFVLTDGSEALYQEALDHFCDGIMDPRTLELLGLQ